MLGDGFTNEWVVVFLVLVLAALFVALVLAGAGLWIRWRDGPRGDS